MTTDRKYLSCADTAKLLRSALKASFPTVKFSVKSKTYSGGASINVSWTDGPLDKDVDAVAQQFAGADFDGMIDLKTYNEHWLMPDGSVSFAHTPGTEGSRGVLPACDNPAPHPEAVRVHFGADFVFTNRHLSPAFQASLLGELSKEFGESIVPEKYYHFDVREQLGDLYFIRSSDRTDNGYTLIHRLSCYRNAA